MTPTDYLNKVQTIFSEHGDPERAEKQMQYMRNQFDYYGLIAPVWQGLIKEIFKTEGIFYGDELREFVRACYADGRRELYYAGIEMYQKAMKKEPEDGIWFLEELIKTDSWWDTVDWLSKLVGIHIQRFPHLLQPVTEKWISTEDIWLQRSAIICQRFYKKNTNTDLLFDYIKRTADSDEFFIQKGAGWALRDYSKIDGDAVIDFVNKNPQLSNLTKREALKWLKSRGLF